MKNLPVQKNQLALLAHPGACGYSPETGAVVGRGARSVRKDMQTAGTEFPGAA
ncbi:hypothetical protein [Radicibacter daui]|uniref:hypothetical protein n=1 Tax=Radicibacter daui TaxID=3064829 RepID=UPI004046E54C